MANEIEMLVRRLLLGLADQEIRRGEEFRYDGGRLLAEDVADLAWPSVLCIAQDLSERVSGLSFGYRFFLGEANPVFPLHAISEKPSAQFSLVGPMVAEVFSGEVMDCRHDLATLFEAAARLVQPGYTLAANTTYQVGSAGPVSVTEHAPVLER